MNLPFVLTSRKTESSDQDDDILRYTMVNKDWKSKTQSRVPTLIAYACTGEAATNRELGESSLHYHYYHGDDVILVRCPFNSTVVIMVCFKCYNLLIVCCRHYFALQTNPGEQFYIFTTLSAWLINQAGKQFDTPQEVSATDISLSFKPILESSSTLSSTPWVPGLSIKQASSLTPHKR